MANLSKEILLPVVKNLAKLGHAVLNVLLRCWSQWYDLLYFSYDMLYFSGATMLSLVLCDRSHNLIGSAGVASY